MDLDLYRVSPELEISIPIEVRFLSHTLQDDISMPIKFSGLLQSDREITVMQPFFQILEQLERKQRDFAYDLELEWLSTPFSLANRKISMPSMPSTHCYCSNCQYKDLQHKSLMHFTC